MKFARSIVLLPCYSLEDLALERDADEAEQLLGAWSALWHPALLASGAQPTWGSSQNPPEQLEQALVILPSCSEPPLPNDWVEQAEKAGACVIRGLPDRDAILEAALSRLDGGDGGVDAELAAEFLALGFCHFQVELLTRQLRYMSNLDEVQMQNESAAAAEAALKGDAETARQRLHAAFDLLVEAREYFYPVEAYLLDLTLVTTSTSGPALREELSTSVPTNLMISAQTLDEIARREPSTLAALKEALEQGRAAIVGGEVDERALPMLTPQPLLGHLERSLAVYQHHLGRRPAVFGRQRFGLTPMLPALLKRLEFAGALHFTLDDGKFPSGNQSKIRWQGFDGTIVEALARLPLHADQPQTFLKLPEKLGESLDLDHTATLVLAHWPGRSSRWYADLKRASTFAPVLGKFTSVEQYFQETQLAGQVQQYGADEYRSPYLQQAVAEAGKDPVSKWVRYYRLHAAADALRALHTLKATLEGKMEAESPVARLLDDVDEQLTEDGVADDALLRRVEEGLEALAEATAASLPPADLASEKGYLLWNPWSFSRRVGLEMPELEELPAREGAIRAVGHSAGRVTAVVDVPSMGFTWVGPGKKPWHRPTPTRTQAKPSWWSRIKRRWPSRSQHGDLPLAEENLLRNEFFEVHIDPHTGAIRAIHDYHSRGNRLAQQIALRRPVASRSRKREALAPDADEHYSIMAADEITVTSPGPALGEIVTRGRLVDRRGRRLARFTQTTQVWRGSRVIVLEIELEVEELPGPQPWNSYYAARFAWGDATVNLARGVHMLCRPTDAVRLEAPYFVEMRSGKVRTSILSAGLPYHRRYGLRKLDSLLIVRGETARRFRLGIGIDVAYPMTAALEMMMPLTKVLRMAKPPHGGTGWLFHVDARNVLVTRWEPLVREARAVGYRAWLLETQGRRVEAALRSFRPVQAACLVSETEDQRSEVPVAGDRCTVELGPHQWVEIEAWFAEQA